MLEDWAGHLCSLWNVATADQGVGGVEGLKNRNCPSSALEISTDTMAQVALIGFAKRRTMRARVRISKVLSDHAVANSWWSPSSLPEMAELEMLRRENSPPTQSHQGSGDSTSSQGLEGLRRADPCGPTPTASEALGVAR